MLTIYEHDRITFYPEFDSDTLLFKSSNFCYEEGTSVAYWSIVWPYAKYTIDTLQEKHIVMRADICKKAGKLKDSSIVLGVGTKRLSLFI